MLHIVSFLLSALRLMFFHRYFNRNKLDYPNNETTRASRKYVKAMKALTVSVYHDIRLVTLGCIR